MSTVFPSVIHLPPSRYPVGGATEATSGMHNSLSVRNVRCRALAEHSHQRGFKHGDALIELLVGYDQRHQQPDDIAIGAGRHGDESIFVAMLNDLFGFTIDRLATFRRADEFDSAHCAQAMDGANIGPALAPSPCIVFETLPQQRGTRAQIFALNSFQNRQRRPAGHWDSD